MCREFELSSTDGLTLHGRDWVPDDEAQSAICFIHGLGDHSGRYAHLAGYLNQNSHAFLAIDLRGHGRSEGRRGFIPKFENLMDDISLLLSEAERRYPKRPILLYGHSMGGNLVINYAIRRRPPITGAIASSPLLRMAFEPPLWKTVTGKIMRALWPAMTVSNGLSSKDLSHDSDVVRAYDDDPLVHDRVSVRFLDIREAGEWALKHAALLPVPILLMHGNADRITDPRASEEFAAAAGETCTLHIWDGLYHEIHNEPEKEIVFARITEWIEGIVGSDTK
jgi:alpha-beta hydrolase superfamily lysophospholipase